MHRLACALLLACCCRPQNVIAPPDPAPPSEAREAETGESEARATENVAAAPEPSAPISVDPPPDDDPAPMDEAPALDPDPSDAPASAPSPPPLRRGTWVYGLDAWIRTPTAVDSFVVTLKSAGINEVYLSAPTALFANDALPPLIERLHQEGLEVEALAGTPAWGTAAGQADLLRYLSALLTYNAAQAPERRFSCAHLDVEPWIGTGSDFSWVVPLLDAFARAREQLGGSGLGLSADLSGPKLANLDLATRQAFFAALDRAVLMQYEAKTSDVIARSERFARELTKDGARGYLVAIRITDFPYPEPAQSTLVTIEDALASDPAYLGWALFHYGTL